MQPTGDPSIESSLVQRFLRSWDSGKPEGLVAFLQAHSGVSLREQFDVVLADQHRRWNAGQPISVREYCRLLPDLAADPSLRRELMAEEIGYLEAFEGHAGREELQARFPDASERTIDELVRTLIRHAERSRTSTMGAARPLEDTHTLDHHRAPADTTIGAGYKFGDYEILEEIARGGMGVVYKARQVKLNRVVALKMILAGQMASREDIERFHVEAEAAANLRHPNIVAIYEIGEIGGRHFFSMEFVEGTSLAHLITDDPLECRRAAGIVRTVAECIEYAHAHGVLHRDIKPSNVLLDEGERPRVMDFGLAKRIEHASGLTMTGQVLGTPGFMPPEQATGAYTADATSDVYSLGALLFALLTTRPPFAGAGAWETISQVIQDEPPSPRSLVPSIHADIETICLKCLRKQPGQRYRSAAALADDLRRYLEGEPIVARPVGRAERVWRWVRRKPITASLVVAVVLVLSVSAGALLLADRARRVETAYERTQELAQLARQFETTLAALKLSETDLAGIEDRIDAVARIDARRRGELETRFHDTLFNQVAGLIRTERLDPDRVAAIEHAIALVTLRDRAVADRLRNQLDNRLSRWNEVYSLSYPFPPLATTFPGAKLEARDKSLVLTDHGDAVLTVSPCQGSSEIEVAFHEGWEDSSQLGLVINWPETGSTPAGYVFLLRIVPSRVPAGIEPEEASFARLRSAGGDAVALEIRRGSDVLQRRWMPAGDLPEGPITIRARRHHTRLTLQIDRLPVLEMADLFSTALHDTGYCGVVWPAGIPIDSIRVQRLVAAREPSPLERADGLYAAAAYNEALAEYARVAADAPAGELRRETQFKHAMCHLALNQDSEALAVFEPLAAESHGRWPLLAAVHSWLLYLEAKRYPDALSILEGLAVHELAEEIELIVPVDIRARIIEWYSDRFTGYFYIRDTNHSKEIETTLAVQRLLGAHESVILSTERELLEVSHLEGRDDRALELAEKILADSRAADHLFMSDVIDRWIRCAMPRGQIDAAFSRLGKMVENDVGGERCDLLIVRARLHAATGRWDLARADLDEAFRLAAPESDARVRAYYFDGLIHTHEGNDAAAKASWATGFDLTRKNGLGYMHSAIMGSLSGTLTHTDARNMVARVAGEGFQSPVMDYLRKQLAPDDLVYTVCLNMWDCPRGRDYVKRDMLFDVVGRDHYEMQVKLTGYEVWRQSVLGVSDRSATLSDDQDEVLWDLSREMMDAYRQGTFAETDVLKVALTWKGQTNFLGWGTLHKALVPRIRGPAAYMFGCRYLHQHKNPELARTFTLDEARMLFEQARADAAPGSALERVAQAELDRLLPGAGADR